MKQPNNGLLALALIGCALALGGCGQSSGGEAKSVADVKPDLAGADARLVAIADQAGQLLGGGSPAFDARLRELKGLPVVVNKWASWCGPCRDEFPEFQAVAKQLGNRVAFLGVNVNDANSNAKAFLKRFPVPYPSYSDPDTEISKQLPPGKYAPVTNIYDASGRLVHTEAGPYESAGDLREDIERYAGPLESAPTG